LYFISEYISCVPSSRRLLDVEMTVRDMVGLRLLSVILS
jgi:hypothetical protein